MFGATIRIMERGSFLSIFFPFMQTGLPGDDANGSARLLQDGAGPPRGQRTRHAQYGQGDPSDLSGTIARQDH